MECWRWRWMIVMQQMTMQSGPNVNVTGHGLPSTVGGNMDVRNLMLMWLHAGADQGRQSFSRCLTCTPGLELSALMVCRSGSTSLRIYSNTPAGAPPPFRSACLLAAGTIYMHADAVRMLVSSAAQADHVVSDVGKAQSSGPG